MNQPISIADNNWSGQPISKEEADSLREIANTPLCTLCKLHSGLLIYPPDVKDIQDDDSPHICDLEYRDGESALLRTGNILGFIGYNNQKLRIYSRFDKGDNDYFLQYLLEKVFSINIFNLQFSFKPENDAFDLMLFLFPAFLKRALNQGLYKEYRKFKHNDSNIRGAIDVPRHIRLNVPFLGKAAYNTREYSYDNHVTQLIRHTIEYMRTHKFGSAVLHSDSELEEAISLISQNTPSYSRPNRIKIVRDNIKPISHPFYTVYEPLRQLCLSILRQETMLFEKNGDPIYGILFNGAWLWEEYLAVLFNERNESKFQFDHLTFENSREYLLKDIDTGKRFQKIIPDYIDRKNKLVADAKYIPLLTDRLSSSRAEGVYYKTIMYMYRYQSPNGFIFYPYSKVEDPEGLGAKKKYSIIGLDNNIIHKIGLIVPAHNGSYADFKSKMKDQEDVFLAKIRRALEGN